MLKSVMFKLGKEHFAIPINKVLSIEKMMDITNVVRMPEYIRGVVNLRGKVVPVVDLRTFLNKSDEIDEKENRLIIVELAGKRMSLVVDEVLNIIDIDEKNIENLENTDSLSIVKHDDLLVMMLDIDKLLHDETMDEAIDTINKFSS